MFVAETSHRVLLEVLVRSAQAYYCVALLVAELPGSAYLNVLWLFLIEPPALGLAVVAADHLGRRVTFGAPV